MDSGKWMSEISDSQYRITTILLVYTEIMNVCFFLGLVWVLRSWQEQYWCRFCRLSAPSSLHSSHPVTEGPYLWKSHSEGLQEEEPVSWVIRLSPRGKTDPFSLEEDNKGSIRGQSRESLREATRRWGRGLWWGMHGALTGKRTLVCDGCWRKSLKCLYDTDGLMMSFVIGALEEMSPAFKN